MVSCLQLISGGCPVRAEIYDNARQMAGKRNLLSSPEVERDFVAVG